MLVMGGYRGVSFFSVGSPLTQTHFVDPLVDSHGFRYEGRRGGERGGARGSYNRWGRGSPCDPGALLIVVSCTFSSVCRAISIH